MGGRKLVLIDTLYRQYDLGHRHVDGAIFKPMVKRTTANKPYRAIRKLHLSSPLPFKGVWLGDWENDLDAVDTVILADGGNSENVARYIHRRHPSMRIILWYRNSVESERQPSADIASFCEIWSFDKADCKEYGYRFNPQFYGGNPTYRERPAEWDVLFVGQDKGRLQKLESIETHLKDAGLTTRFCIVGRNCDYMPYEKIIDLISRSRAILDVPAEWQDGITLRPLEALFYRKKLLTTSDAYAESDMCDRANAFLIGHDDWSTVRDFVQASYQASPNHADLIHKYGIEGWLDRFDGNTRNGN